MRPKIEAAKNVFDSAFEGWRTSPTSENLDHAIATMHLLGTLVEMEREHPEDLDALDQEEDNRTLRNGG